MGFCQNLAVDSAHDKKGLHFQPCSLKCLLHTVAETAASLLAKAQAVSKG